jgi:hypothetical protein
MEDIKLTTPDYEELVLPSNGLVNGLKKLFIRPITMREEKLLTNKTLSKTGKVHDEIFKACIGYGEDVDGNRVEKSDINIDDFYIEDEYAIFVFLRIISYGMDYDVKVACPECEEVQDVSVNLETLPVTYADESTPKTVTVELPKAGTTVEVSYPTKRDSNESGGDTYEMLPQLVRKAEGVPDVVLDQWVQGLIGLDVSVLRKSVGKAPFGMSKEFDFVCNNSGCSKSGVKQEVDLPITAEFFRI